MASPQPHDIAWFASPAELRSWLAVNHTSASELWVGMRPKAVGLPTVTWHEVVDEVLCAGWIDSVRYSVEGGSCIRITPRRKGSVWSARNVGRVKALRAEGRMLPAGEAAFALRRDDRTAVYSFEREGELDDAAVAALRGAGGWTFFEAQPKTYRRSASYWVMSAKRPGTRAKRLGALVEASAAGERVAAISPRPVPKGQGVRMTTLTRDLADGFASLALSHVSREYPNKLDHVLAGPEDVAGPRALHPVFFGSFDWHSCVHGYWLLARALRRFPELPSGPRIEALFAERFSPQNVAAEVAYLARPGSRGFERPYGWAWLLALQAELDRAPGGAARTAADTLRPLADAFAARFEAFLPLADYPVRAGAHTSTAFALRLAADHAEARHPALFELMRDRAVAWYGADRDAQAWEPSGDDFLSPTLVEAECMRRFLEPGAFRAWFDAFLPRAGIGEPATLFVPARLSDRSDGKIAHLDGLNLSRAWCWRGIAVTLGTGDPRAERFEAVAASHLAASLPHVAGDYMGEHWLATFATLALDGA